MRKRLLTVVAVVVVLSLTLSAVSLAQDPAEKVFKLGVVADITGVAARTGIEQKNAIQMYFDEIGEQDR